MFALAAGSGSGGIGRRICGRCLKLAQPGRRTYFQTERLMGLKDRRFKILWFGSDEFSARVLQAVIQDECEVFGGRDGDHTELGFADSQKHSGSPSILFPPGSPGSLRRSSGRSSSRRNSQSGPMFIPARRTIQKYVSSHVYRHHPLSRYQLSAPSGLAGLGRETSIGLLSW